MADCNEGEILDATEETVVRRTRSGRTVKSVSSPAPKTRGRKKVSVSEELTEEEECQKMFPIKEVSADNSENSNGLQCMDQQMSESQFAMAASDSNEPSEELESASESLIKHSEDNSLTQEHTSESELDADEENVDNQIIEISSGTAQVVASDLVETNDNSADTQNIDDSDLPQKLMSVDSSESALEDDESKQEVADVEHIETDVQNFISETITSAVESEVDAQEMFNTEEPDPDTEMVSEDELPAPPKAKVPEDAEEVSDEELPGPKLAELPADTEVVSEDELPTVKAAKRKHEESGYDPSSPTDSKECSGSSKRLALESTVEAKEEKDDKKTSVKSRKLPDLDKYWKAVRDDPGDFTGWTYLLQYVDQENEIEPAREAYDAFLAHYPYCYGYWRKYADYEKRKGNKKKCEEVFDRGLRAIPLSVDLWLHYLTYQKATYGDDTGRIREQFERALSACGLEFRSDRLWEGYIKWELEEKNYRKVMEIYDRLLATPTFGYMSHFDSFQEFVTNNQPPQILSQEEFLLLRAESRTDKDIPTDSNIPPGEDEANDNMRNDEECAAIKQLLIASRHKIHKNTIAEVTARWSFEEGIKRPYFHVKPLERCQLNNWKDYLDYETQHGSQERVIVLYERCLIACALYEEFWLRLVRYLETQNDEKLVNHMRDVFERGCTVHHPDKPTLHLLWAAFEENHNAHSKAADILIHIEKTCPNVLQIAYRRINLERRRGDLEKCVQLFEHYIQTLKNKTAVAGLVIKYARFCHKILGNMDKALEILKAGIERDPSNSRLSLQLIDFYMQRSELNFKEIVGVIDAFLDRDPEIDQRVLFAQRKLEFLEDFGTAESLQEAQRSLQTALTKLNKKKDSKRDSSPSKKSKDAAGSVPPLPATTSYQGTNNSQYGSPYNTSQSSMQSGAYGYPAHGSYNQGYPTSSTEYPYQWGQYSQGQYSGYGAWGSYPNYY